MVKAIRIHKTGGPEVLQWEDITLPAPGPGEILVRNRAIGLNFIDTYFRSGLYAAPQMPFVPGNEGAGEILAVGPNVAEFKVGDRVAYVATLGSYAEERIVAAGSVVALPGTVSYEAAASMMLKGMTAEYLLHRTYKVKQGDTILVHAAAGGTGLILCQWGKALGATVIGTVGSQEKAELAKAHGADHTILYREENFPARVKEITGGKLCDVVYDGVGKDTFLPSLDCSAALRRAGELWQCLGRGRAVQSRPARPQGLALRDAADPVHPYRQARDHGRDGCEPVRGRRLRQGDGAGQRDLRLAGRGQCASRARKPGHDGLDGADPLRSALRQILPRFDAR
jgi:NADPH2:quinone reductase